MAEVRIKEGGSLTVEVYKGRKRVGLLICNINADRRNRVRLSRRPRPKKWQAKVKGSAGLKDIEPQ